MRGLGEESVNEAPTVILTEFVRNSNSGEFLTSLLIQRVDGVDAPCLLRRFLMLTALYQNSTGGRMRMKLLAIAGEEA